MDKFRRRRVVAIIFMSIGFISLIANSLISNTDAKLTQSQSEPSASSGSELAIWALKKLPIRSRASSAGYDRKKYGAGWSKIDGCDTRNIILNRDLTNKTIGSGCEVLSGTLNDPYTGRIINFKRGKSSGLVQIDHVVALSDAWQKGAQKMTYENRVKLANDSLELLAVDGKSNEEKSGGDAAAWLPPNKGFRCEYVSRQIEVKVKYSLWITQSEYNAMERVLLKCPNQLLPSP